MLSGIPKIVRTFSHDKAVFILCLEKRSIVNRWLKQHFLIWDSVLRYAENIQKRTVSWIGAERHTAPHSFKTFTFKRMFAILVNYLNIIIPFIETNTISTCRISAKCVSTFKQASQYNPHQQFHPRQYMFNKLFSSLLFTKHWHLSLMILPWRFAKAAFAPCHLAI